MKFLSKLPAGSQVLLGVVGGLFPVVCIMSTLSPAFARYWMIGYGVIFAVSTLATLVQVRADKKSAQDLDRDVIENIARTSSTSSGEDKAKHVGLLTKFQSGLDLYKKYDKSVYDLPWYVLVGEIGSGKTEAMLRSEIGFPEKLGNLVKGAGGTFDMNWWFANDAVVLDTAGRLFMAEGSEASRKTSMAEWTTFLRLLQKSRPACPINGLILVIPATALVVQVSKEAEEQSLLTIKNCAARMASQMERIQTELRVRFPVYVLVTKTDKIPGFRDFFNHITAKERYQIFGWSNPDDLDVPYSFAEMAKHAAKTVGKLRQLCLELLKDPVPKDLTKARRFDEVDDLFTFADNYEKMIPKLKCYLDDIFTPDLREGEGWSTHPCFLRGVYFTSALEKGPVLNPVLARSLNKTDVRALDPKEDPGQDPLPTAHTQYFIRDLFQKKIFREKGLVTRAGNIKREASSGRRWLVNSLLAGLGVVAVMGYIMSTNAPAETELWRQIDTPLNGASGGDRSFSKDEAIRHASFAPFITMKQGVPQYEKENLKNIAKLSRLVEGQPYFGWLFAPMVWTSGWGGMRQDAFSTVARQGVATPLVEAALEVLGKPGRFANRTSDADLRAVQALVKLKAAADLRRTAGTPEDGEAPAATPVMSQEDVASLLTCVFGEDEDLGGKRVDQVAGIISTLLKVAGKHSPWPPDGMMKPSDKVSNKVSDLLLDKTNQSVRLYKVLVTLLPQGAEEEAQAAAGGEKKAVADFAKALASLQHGAEGKKLDFELCHTALSDMHAAAQVLDKIKPPPVKSASAGTSKLKAQSHRKKPAEILAMLKNPGENAPGLGGITDKLFARLKKLKDTDMEDSISAPPSDTTADKFSEQVTTTSGEARYQYQQILEWLEQAHSLHGVRDPDKLTTEGVKAIQGLREQVVKAAGEEYKPLVLWLQEHWADEFVRLHLKAYLRFPLVNTPNDFYQTTGPDARLPVALRLLDILGSRREFNAGLRKVLQVRDLVFDFPGGDLTAPPVVGSWTLTAHPANNEKDWNTVHWVEFGFVNREPVKLVVGRDTLMREGFVNAPLYLRAGFKSGEVSPEFNATGWGPVQLLLRPAGQPAQVPGSNGSKWDVLLGTDSDSGAQVKIEVDAKGRGIPNPEQWPTAEELSTSAR